MKTYFLKKIYLSFFLFLLACNLFSQQRTFTEIFPSAGTEVLAASFTQNGHYIFSRSADTLSLIGGSSSGIPAQITNNVLRKSPGYIIESIHVFPYDTSNLTMLDIYNALGNIRNLKGIMYDSHTRGQPTPLFEEATRIISETRTTAISDPAPAASLPDRETFYIRLKDVNFGNTYYRAEISVIQNGLSYSLTNFRGMTYFLISFIRTEKFTAQLYIEPIREGVLIYSIAGADISDFAANRVDVNSAIAKRLGVITTWASNEILRKAAR